MDAAIPYRHMPTYRYAVKLLGALTALSLAVAAHAADRHPTAAETRAEFEAICARITGGRNPYYGRQAAEQLKRQIEQERAAGVPLDPEMRVGMRGRLGEELLRLAHPAESVRWLKEALEIADERQLGAELRSRLLYSLGLAYMQLAEEQNCVVHHAARSCILPIDKSAVHKQPEAARAAAGVFLRFLEQTPSDMQTRWLLNLARMVSGDFPEGVPEALRMAPFVSAVPFPAWRDRAPELGTAVVDLAGGAIMDDFDGDGRLDLVTSTMDPCTSMTAFRNDGKGGFENVTAAWGLDGQLGGLNVIHADYDNDGDLDLLLLRGGWLGDDGRIRKSLLRNDLNTKTKRFVDATVAAGLAHPAYPTQTAAWADYDGDGDLDLYSGNESSNGQVFSWSLVESPGRPFPSQLFRNNGDGTFTDVARAAGVTNMRFTKGAAWGDYDDDGDPDLYVSNIGANRLYRNDGRDANGNVTFTDVAPELGVTAPDRASFATWFFDYDNDGDLDLFVNDYSAPIRDVTASYLGESIERGHPILYRNDGGKFRNVSREIGLTRPLLPMGANYGDLDNDGWLDFVLGTGVPDLDALMPDVAYRSNTARRFDDVTFASGLGHLQKGHGVAFGDLDGDGDQDLLRQMGGAYPADAFANALYENPSVGTSWITLRLRGEKSNRSGIGARIAVEVREGDRTRAIHALAGSGGSFGGSSLQQEIGLGKADAILAVTIVWPGSGTVQRFENVGMNRVYVVHEGKAELE